MYFPIFHFLLTSCRSCQRLREGQVDSDRLETDTRHVTIVTIHNIIHIALCMIVIWDNAKWLVC